MTKSLNDLLACCSCLSSEKPTERKQGASKLEFLLKDNEVIHALDERSVRKSRSREDLLNWDYLVEQVRRFVEIEVDNIKGDQASSACKKKHKEIAQLYQCVVGKAEKRGPALKIATVYSHILNMFFKVDKTSCFIEIYTNILLKCLLVKRKHACELGVKKWHEFVNFYFSLLLHSKEKNKGCQIPYARIIQQLLLLSHTMSYIQIDEILNYFNEIFQNIRQEKSHVFLEYILSALTSFCWVTVTDARGQICELGENHFHMFVQLWKRQITTTKVRLIDIFQLQILAHFSPNMQLIKDKTYPWMSETWKGCLKEMFQLVYIEFLQLSEKIQISSKSIFQRKEMIEFVTSVIHQIYLYTSDNLDITISCTISSTMNKKSKVNLQSVWNLLIEGLKNVSEPKACITWLDVTCCLFSKEHLRISGANQIVEVINVLASLLSENNREDVTRRAVTTLHCSLSHICGQSELLHRLHDVINTIWNSSIRIFELSEDKDNIFQLLHCCWKSGVVSSTYNIFQIFDNQGCQRSYNSMKLLCSILKSSNFPNCPKSLESNVGNKTSLTNHPLRKQLMDWLLPLTNQEAVEPIWYKKANVNVERDELDLLCTLLTSLMCISPANVVQIISNKECSKNLVGMTWTDMQQEYLISMHDLKIDMVRDATNLEKSSNESKLSCRCLKDAETYLLKRIVTMTNNILNSTEKDVEIYCVELFVVITLLQEKLQSSTSSVTLVNCLKGYTEKLISKFVKLLEKLINGENENDTTTKTKTVANCLKCLDSLIFSHTSAGITYHLPENLIELLTQITEGDFITVTQMTQHRTFDQINSTVSFDDMEFECDQNDELPNKASVKGVGNPLDADSLNEMEKVQLSAFKIAVMLMFLNPDKYEHQRRNFFNVFMENGKEDNSKLQMLVALNSMVEEYGFKFSPSELLITVNCARRYLSAHRFDMDVCAAILTGMVCYINQLKISSVVESNEETKITVLKVIEVFWSLRNEKYSPFVRIKLVDTLIALSQIEYPDVEWKLAVPSKNDGSEALVFAPELFIQTLYDENLLVRSHSSLHLNCLFTNDNEENKMFGFICTALDTLINLENSHCTKDDLFFTHEITLLLVCKKLICCCNVLERKGLWLLFQFAKQQIVKQEHVFKVLQDISVKFGYDNVYDLMSPRAMYIIFTFILKGFTIDTFPSGCLGLSMTDFLRSYYQCIIPCYVLRNDFEAIDEIGNLLGFNYDLHRLLMDSFELTVVHTLPIYSGYLDGGKIDEKKALILEGSKQFRERIGEEFYNLELERRFDKIILQLILRLHDPQKADLTMSRFTLDKDSSPFYPTFSSTQISISLSHLAVGFGKDTTISSFLKFPESIPSILCNLALYVTWSKRSSERLSPIKSYFYFTMLLLENLHHLENYGGSYIIREIIYRLLHFIEENEKETSVNCSRIISICFEILETLCEKISSHLYVSKELSKHLCFITSKLTRFATKGSANIQALRILQYLIDDSTQNEDFLEYNTAVSLLDDFPSQRKFVHLNDSLVAIKRDRQLKGFDEELKRIASNLKQLNSSVPTSVLENLKRILAGKTDSIVLGEPLKDIVSCLMRICSQGDAESTLLAVDCLGLIGPMPISAINGSGHIQSSELPHYLFSVCPLKFYVVIEALLQLCIHKCSLVSKTAWNCLLRLIKWDVAKDILLTYKDMPFFSYIHPYLVKRKKVDKLKNVTGNPSFEALANNVLCDKETGFDSIAPHGIWLPKLVSTLLTSAPVDDKIFLVLEPLCQLHVDFARLSLTFVVHNMIISHDENKKVLNIACQTWIDIFLAADEETREKKDMRKKMMEVIFLITSLRSIDITSNKSNGVTCWNNNFWLEFNYFKLAECAFLCGQYYNAAMFIEIWSDPLRKSAESNPAESKVDKLTRTNFNCATPECQSLLYKIYSHIGDVDAIYGVDTNASMQAEKRLQLLQCEKEFHKALLSSDLTCTSMKCSSDVLQTLMKSELYHTALMYLHSVSDEEMDKFSEIQFEAAWRNGQWNTTQLRHGLSSKLGFHGSLYQSFISLETEEEDLFKKHINNAKLSIISCIQAESNSSKALYGVLSRCFTLTSLETAGNCLLRKNVDGIKCPSALSNDFSYYEPSLSVVSQAIKIKCINMLQDQENDFMEKSMKHLINHCKLARESQRYEVAEKFISLLSTQCGIANASPEWKLEEAKVYWDRKETNHAMHVLRQLMNQVKDVQGDKSSYMYPLVLGLYGHWLGETKSQNPVHIMENYLEPAICMMEEESFSSYHSPIDAYHSLAKYADAQYRSLRDYVKSPMFQTKQVVIKRNQDELNKFEVDGKKQNTDRMVEVHFKMLEKQCMEDKSELQQTLTDHQTFLEKAIQNYCKCLQYGDKYNLKVLRLCSLWFEHHSEDAVNNQTKVCFPKIKSSKFLPVMYQLAARLGTKMTTQCNTFKEILEAVIERCCIDHPHHSIFILLALCNADYEENLIAKPKKRLSKGASKNNAESDKSRINAARSVLARVRSSKGSLVQDAEKLAMAYIDLAYWDITHLKNEKGSFIIPDARAIRKIASLSSVAIPTVEIEIDPLCEYENVVHIVKFDQSFTHAGGVNLPKIITCIGSDGNRRKQLIKGRDDLRQDAVMQQVFRVVNLLLKSDPETRRRDLCMRTYKIVPLSRKSGLMEWCEGTVPLGNYLIGGRDGTIGAHTRYFPKDWSGKDCRNRLNSATVTEGKRSKYNVYQEIQNNFHPVFRHFFYEKFRDPADWFAKRLSYTRSTAVSSIVGYIVGLGDRHCQNILIDCNSAEVVHIDLGVAFEKGKLLPTPETIPFRLTRDIIDGMGINGIEGVFRRCCEKMMGVMRNSQEGILTIVEVLLYDPLSDWTITSEKLKKLQKSRDSEENGNVSIGNGMDIDNSCSEIDTDRNKTAERVLMRLKQKLAGSEGGAFLGIPGHVNYLIQEACNPQNLCRLFPGWQPWL